ncbi:uncharacterized protein V1510DRAFT_418082 [Dipodascopsis tothii]|uniref:uncharacterized protein n=1 Tax=Dipodascopsis tothii TaxID=44089 RepID=UPI0034CE4D61
MKKEHLEEQERQRRERQEQLEQQAEEFARYNICKFYASTGTCRKGSACTFSHERKHMKTRKYTRYEKPQQMPLFKRLVQNDWDKEDDKILDVIAYLADKGLIHESRALRM